MAKVLVLSYSGCSTCKKALKFLDGLSVKADVRPIVTEPPTPAELEKWIPRSGKPVQKWLNTSGLSYRALGKEKVSASTDTQLRALLAADGKLVKRPVLVDGGAVLVGFNEAEWSAHFGRGGEAKPARGAT